jgi:3-deoxy-manno-octulosonate cytidylyltransferase (CMP-KDO synthetase)
MRAVAIIPARVGSTRFPGKVLAAIDGRPLVVHVWERACEASLISEVVVATDSTEVAEAISVRGGRVVMSSDAYETGSDRVASAAIGLDADVVVNVQADNGDLNPSTIDAVVAMFDRPEVMAATPVAEFPSDQSLSDPSKVKARVDANGVASVFTRQSISDGYLHIGVYGFRPEVLQRYASWERGRLELDEQLEQLRLLENGVSIHAVVVDDDTVGVDTLTDMNHLLNKLSPGPMDPRF